jgi:hypothetical protein
MADEETKQLLREILDTQKEQLALLRSMDKAYQEQTQSFTESSASYRTAVKHQGLSTLLWVLSLAAIAVVLVYVVFFGIHTH